MKEIILTGIKPTGTPHIGNYFGAIKPAIELINNANNICYYFIADYHALTTVETRDELKTHTLEVAATWLACGLDPNKVVFYKQSDIKETFELTTILTNVTPKGLLNRAHAYKAKVERNKENGLDADDGVNMGLYNYPVLMAADILLFNTTKVPVGLDQKQHIEIARDICTYFNNKFKKSLTMPEGIINENVATILGLDGRKMSKSYNNTIELFCDENKLKKTINRIVTDSTLPNEPKGTDNTIFALYKLFASENELKEFKQKLASGIAWSEAKNMLYELINKTLKPMREKFNYYMANPQIVNNILQDGANKARQISKETIKRVRTAIGVE